MKRKKLMALLLTMGIILTGCGDIVDQRNAETVEAISGNKENTQDIPEDSSMQEKSEGFEEQNSEGEMADHTDSDMVEITNETLEDEIRVSENSVIHAYAADFPVITVKGNQVATEAIQKDIEEREEEFLKASEELQKEAQELYDNMVAEGQEENFSGYHNYLGYFVSENNGKILSVIFDNWSYLGGAHGSTVKTTANYSLETGELLTFDTFFENKESAVESIKENILKQCGTPYYQEMLFPEYETYIDDIIKEDYWYFDNVGMHIVANEYALAAYAAGSQDFIIPYEEIPEMKQEYVKQSVYLYPALQGQDVEMDMDSDGKLEIICYDMIEEEGDTYIYDGIEYEMYSGVRPSILINGEEYGQVLMGQEYYWTESPDSYCYFVDLNKNDSYIELAIVDYGVNDNPHTYFFRYDKGEIKYLGSVTDTVTSDTCEFLGDGTLKASVHSNTLETIRLDSKFEVQGERLREADIEWYDMNVDGQNRTHDILKDVTVFTEKSIDSATKVLTKEDGPVIFVATDNEEWVKIQTKDGGIFYLHLTSFSEIHSGSTTEEAMDIFSDLLLAG